MIVVSGTMSVAAADHDAAVALMQTLMTETAKESGNISYAFYADLAQPGAFRVFEEWEDQASIDAHFAEPHMAAFMGAIGELGVSGTAIDRYEVTEKTKLM